MKNRAKCKLCKSIIESFHSTDYIACACGEIALDSGEGMKCFANDFSNFLRVDDKGNEIEVKFKEDISKIDDYPRHKPTKKEVIEMLEEMVKKLEDMPEEYNSSYATQIDIYSLSLVMLSFLRADD